MGTLKVSAPRLSTGRVLMAKGYAGERVRHHVLAKVLVLLLVALLAYGAWLGLSVQRVRGLLSDAQQAYHAMQVDFEAQDYQGALSEARTAATAASQLKGELDGVQWNVVAALPILGTDVRVARTVGDVSADFSDKAVIPVLDAWDDLTASGVIVDGSFDVQALTNKIDQVKVLVDTLEDASTVATQCSNQLAEVPSSHFEELNQATEKLQSAVTSTDEALETMSAGLSVVGGVSGLLSDLFN